MDHHANHPVFGGFAVSAVFFGSSKIKTDHRVFHSISRFNTLRNGVGIGYGKF